MAIMRVFLIFQSFLLGILYSDPADAVFHLLRIREVYAGSAANPNSQYVLLQMAQNNQNQVSHHGVQVYDESGTVIGDFEFPVNVANGVTQDYILVATSAAEAEFGITADLIMDPIIPRSGGRVCFDSIDCVSWGSYSGSSTTPSATGTPFNRHQGLLPGRAMRRDISPGNANLLQSGDDSNDSVTDFLFAAAPLPKNNSRQSGYLPQVVSLSTSVNAGGTPDAAVVQYNAASDLFVATTYESSDGSNLGSVGFSGGFDLLYFDHLSDLNANGHDELVFLGIDQDLGTIRAEIRDSASGALIRRVLFFPGFIPQLFSVVPDVNANNADELAILGIRRSDGALQLEIRDGGTGAQIRTTRFTPDIAPVAMTVLDDINSNGQPEMVVVGARNSDGVVRAQARDLATGVQTSVVFFPAAYLPEHLDTVADMNGNGTVELALLGVRADGRTLAIIRDSATGVQQGVVAFRNDFPTVAFHAVPDLNGNNTSELLWVGVGQALTPSPVLLEVKDSLGAATLNSANFGPLFFAIDTTLSDDVSGNSVAELGLLGRTQDGSQTRIQFRDASDPSYSQLVNVP